MNIILFTMNILTTFFLFTSNLLNLAVWVNGSNEYHHKDVYWMDYEGLIPLSAIEGGTFNNTVIYIGQVLVPSASGIIPVSIFPGNTSVSGTYYYVGSFTTDNYIKILCTNSRNKNFYKWLLVTQSSFPDAANLVVGGYDFNTKVYIGRANINGNTYIGKVFDHSLLHITTNLNTQDHIETFEILAFLPDEESLVGSILSPSISSKKEYYWRPYDGEISEDALEGGRKNFKTTYIGLIPTEGGITPANIYPGVVEALGEYFGAYRQDKHVQILCSNNKHNFEWLNVTKTTVLNENDLVQGGIERSSLLTYIARAEEQGDIIIGKMFLMFNPHEDNVMHFATDVNSFTKDYFQVLTYKRRQT